MASKRCPVHLPESPHGCPMESLLRLLSGPWTTYILWTLHQNGPTRFGALKRAIGDISAKVLTERLRLLENAGVVARAINPTIPPEVTYSLTPEGLELVGVFESLDALAKKWAAKATTQDADSAMR